MPQYFLPAMKQHISPARTYMSAAVSTLLFKLSFKRIIEQRHRKTRSMTRFHENCVLPLPLGRRTVALACRHRRLSQSDNKCESIAATGLPDTVSVHGARYTAATRLWEILRSAGHADDMARQAVGSITGHETAAMARKYTSIAFLLSFVTRHFRRIMIHTITLCRDYRRLRS